MKLNFGIIIELIYKSQSTKNVIICPENYVILIFRHRTYILLIKLYLPYTLKI